VSGLAEHVASYLVLRRALGYQLVAHERLLADFAGYLEERDQPRITVDAALEWATGPADASPGLIALRLSVVRRFAGYVAVFDPDTEIPPKNLRSADTARSVPYVFSPQEVQALMAAARGLRPPLRAASFHTLIGFDGRDRAAHRGGRAPGP
jgi:integrase/recombinase XerD